MVVISFPILNPKNMYFRSTSQKHEYGFCTMGSWWKRKTWI